MLTFAMMLMFASEQAGPSEAVPIAPEQWVTMADYPASARAARREGTTTVLLTVTRRGLVEECRVARSSGFADLDSATCMALAQRARFTPARNGHGERISTQVTRTVRWTPPT